MESVPKCPLQGTHSSLTGEGLLPHSLLEWSEWLLGARKQCPSLYLESMVSRLEAPPFKLLFCNHSHLCSELLKTSFPDLKVQVQQCSVLPALLHY